MYTIINTAFRPTCLYLASKIEGFFLTIDEFVSKFTKVNTQDIIEMEMPVCESLKFHFTIYQPYRPLYGFFLDLQVSWCTCIPWLVYASWDVYL
jgi:hypothetical protein